MPIPTLIFIIFTLLTTVIVTIIVFKGIFFIRQNRHNRNLYLTPITRHNQTSLDTYISVIVKGTGSIPDLERWLSLNYTNYELIYICDFDQIPDKYQLLAQYQMIRNSYVGPTELNCNQKIRNIFTSRNPRYKRLLMVDYHTGPTHQLFNCGANLSNYEYIFCADEQTHLTPDTLKRLAVEIEYNPGKQLYAVRCFHSDALDAPISARLDNQIDMLCHGAGFDTYDGHKGFRNVSVLFKREALISAGGFRSDYGHDAELLRRLTYLPDYKPEYITTIPEILTYSRPRTGQKHEHKISTPALTLKISFFIIITGIVFFLVYHTLAHQWKTVITLTWLCIYLYIYCLTIAILSLRIDEPIRNKKNRTFDPAIVFGILTYPIHYTCHMLRLKKFH